MKYIVDIPDGYIPYKATNEKCLIFPGDPSFEIFDESKMYVAMGEKAIEKLRNEGREEAWALARKIAGSPANGNYDWPVLREIFGGGWTMMKIFDDSYETVKKKISDYENRIKVGDIVILRDSNPVRGVVTNIEKDSEFCYAILFEDGLHGSFHFDDLEKTGEHIDLADIFKKLKGEE